jgi:hypothetical protein
MKSWGRYEIVASPAEADLIFEIQYANPIAYDEKLARYDLHFRLTILDPKTHVILWSLTENFQKYTGLQRNRDKHFDETLDKLMDDVKKLVGEPAATDEKK